MPGSTIANDIASAPAGEFLDRVARLNAQYRAGEIRAHVPEALQDGERSLEELVERHLPASHAAFQAASRSLFFSLPVAFDPAQAVGPYLAIVDRDLNTPPGSPVEGQRWIVKASPSPTGAWAGHHLAGTHVPLLMSLRIQTGPGCAVR